MEPILIYKLQDNIESKRTQLQAADKAKAYEMLMKMSKMYSKETLAQTEVVAITTKKSVG